MQATVKKLLNHIIDDNYDDEYGFALEIVAYY